MYIKIKNIKRFVLVWSCFALACFNYLNYVKAEDVNNAAVSCDKTNDSDCDSMTASEEKLYGTNSEVADTDGDGYSDGVEVKSGYSPLIPAPGDRVNLENQNNTTNFNAQASSLTEQFTEEIQQYVDSKGSEAITSADIQEFSTTVLSDKIGTPISLSTLPEVDRSKIKIIPQAYSSLTESQRKERLRNDASIYITKITYLAASNAPVSIVTIEDFHSMVRKFELAAATLSSENPDLEYFSDLGNRFDLLLNQVYEVEVPETIVEHHVKLMRIVMGFLALRNDDYQPQDHLARQLMLTNVQNLTDLTVDFLQTDLEGYLRSLE